MYKCYLFLYFSYMLQAAKGLHLPQTLITQGIMKRVLLLTGILLSAAMVAAQTESTTKLHLWASKTAQYNINAQLVSLIPDFHKDEQAGEQLSRYGHNLNIRTDSTGFFYVKKIDDRWWLIDPDGYAGMNMAVTTILTPDNKAEWAYDLLKELGFNGAGNFITPENLPIKQYNDRSFEQFSYTRRGLGDRNTGPTQGGGFFQRYQSYRKTKGYTFPSGKDNGVYITIMDPEFEEFCDIHAKNYVAPHAGERNMLGVFSDNEINFSQDQIYNFLKDLPQTDPNYQSALEFITTKGITKEKVLTGYSSISNAIKEEYAGIIAERYYRLVSAAIRKYDTNHLYLGSRLHGRPRGIKAVVEAASRYCDVISVNFYNYPTPKDEIANPKKWGIWTNDKPCLITEFYTKGLEPSGIDLQPGAGYMVQTQQDRATFYQNSCLEVLQSKYYIGWQYFRWMDDDKTGSATSNKGIVSPTYDVWPELSAAMKELNTQVYPLIDFFDGRTYIPRETSETVLHPTCDTYVSLKDEVIHGAENTLSVSKTDRQEIFLKFDLSGCKDKLSALNNAKVRLYDASGSLSACDLKIYGVDTNDWSETSLNGAIVQGNKVMGSSYGRLRSKQVTPTSEAAYIDLPVRSWLVNAKSIPESVTFRIIDNSSEGQTSVWHSKEQGDTSKAPQLILTTDKSQGSGLQISGTSEIGIYQNGRTLNYIGLEQPTQCSIYSIMGICLYDKRIQPGEYTELDFPAGVYVVKLNSDTQSGSWKIVVR